MPPARSRKRDDFYRDRRRRKVCAFCADKTTLIDYKEVNRLRRYLSERAKIEPRRKTGTCAGHQRELAVALKRARHVALLPYAPQHLRPWTVGRVASSVVRRGLGVVGLLMLAGGAAAGVFGSLLGLGGGILIVPLLTLGFGLDLREAVGVSLVSVIMTSSVAAGVYLERHVADLRLGMRLELFTAIGALVGGSIAFLIDERWLSVLFAALARVRRHLDAARRDVSSDDEPGCASRPAYEVRNLPIGVVGSTGAGVASALLGVGGGIIKVPLMHLAMGVPLRVATATSNLMVGITAAASAVIYLIHGEIDPYVAGPTAIGVFLGREPRVARRPPDRPADPALAVRRRPALHGGPDAPASGVVMTMFDRAIGRLLIVADLRRHRTVWSSGSF